MREVVIQIPTFAAEQNIDIDVKINGKKRSMFYRVEIVEWEAEDEETQDRVAVVRRVIQEHEKDWELIQNGIPTRDNIPIMFRKKAERIESRI